MKTTPFCIGIMTLLLVACDKEQPAASQSPKRPSLAERKEAKRKEIAARPPVVEPVEEPLPPPVATPIAKAPPAAPPPTTPAPSTAERDAQRAEEQAQRVAKMTEQFKARMTEQDVNGDGLLTKDEMAGPMQRGFERLDSNGDGAIDSTEREAMIKDMADRMSQFYRGQGRGPVAPVAAADPVDPAAAEGLTGDGIERSENPGGPQSASAHGCQCGDALPCYCFHGPSGSAMPSIFHTSTPLSASAEVMFGFHSDPSNLRQVMPPTLTLVSLKTDGPAQEGRLIELHCRDWWIIPMRWTCRWKTVQPPHLLVDEIVKGPFTQFVHEHRFEAQGADRCVMHDTITYQWGRSWWGRLVSETGVRLYLTLLFKYRHFRTRKWADAV